MTVETHKPAAKTTGVVQPLPGIGDMIWFLPALKALAAAAPDGKITLFTKSSSQAQKVLGAEPMIEKVVYLPLKKRGALTLLSNFFGTWSALFHARPDRLIIMHRSFRYRLAAWLAGIREVIIYPRDVARLSDNGWSKSLRFLKEIGVPVAQPNSSLAVHPAAIAAVKQQFDRYPQPWVIVAVGATEPSRLWPAERFAFCADALVEKTSGTVFLIGGSHEAERIEAVRSLCKKSDRVIPVVGIPFDHVMGLMSCSLCLFGNDSGPSNVSAALGCPTFSLAGASDSPRHSPHLYFIKPPLSVQGEGMERISAEYALGIVWSTLGLTA